MLNCPEVPVSSRHLDSPVNVLGMFRQQHDGPCEDIEPFTATNLEYQALHAQLGGLTSVPAEH